MFQQQGIRTYLNDELLLVLPNDIHVRIRESSTNYTATLASDTLVYAVAGENDTVERAKGQVGQFDGHRSSKISSTLALAIYPSIASTLPSNICAVTRDS
eukprot:6177319-Pleurochrysis_carterae.AAC.1